MSAENDFKKDVDLGSASPEDDEGLDSVFEIDDIGVSEVFGAIGKLWNGYIGGDDDVRINLEDAGRRWMRFKEERPESGIWFWRTVMPLLLVVYSLLVMIRLAIRPTMRGLVAAPSFLGDIMFANIVFIALPVFGYFMISKIAGQEVSGGTFGGAMTFSKVFQVVIVAVLLLMFIPISGFDSFLRWLTLANGYYTSVPGLPAFSISELSTNMFLFGLLISFPYGSRYIRARSAMILAKKEDVSDPDVEEEEEKSLEELITWVGRQEGVSREFDRSVEEVVDVPESLRREFDSGYKEVERYWLRVPYSYACISYNSDRSDYRYHTIEPEIESKEEMAVLEQYRDNLSTALLREDIGEESAELDKVQEEKSRRLEDLLREISTRYDIQPDRRTFQKILYFIERDQVYYGDIDPLMNDQNVEDISCDGDDVPVFVFHQEYKDLMTDIRFPRDELRSFVIQLAQRSGEHLSVADPIVKASLPDGSRAQITLGTEVTDRGSTFTIRKFEDIPFTPVDLIRSGTFSLRQMAYIWMAIENKKSLMFAGGTASGKTTSLNAISLFIPPKSKVISIEDTREVSLPHQNWIPKKTREKFGDKDNKIGMHELLMSALRQRPEYMIVGEIRGEEARALFQAIETGHTTYSTMHTDTVEGAFQRLQNDPINVPKESIASLDIISIQSQVTKYNEDKEQIENLRRNKKMSEITQDKNEVGGEIVLRVEQDPIFKRGEDGKIKESGLYDSEVLDEIRKDKGWSQEELIRNLEEREKVLQYLIDNDIDDVRKITRTIQVYSVDREKTINKIENGTFDPSTLGRITDSGFDESQLARDEYARKTDKQQLEGDKQ